jgi:hypothetical protein
VLNQARQGMEEYWILEHIYSNQVRDMEGILTEQYLLQYIRILLPFSYTMNKLEHRSYLPE